MNEATVFDNSNIWKVLLKIAPPVMVTQLIQALYNIIDSFFVGQYSGDGLTALSIIYPIQFVLIAFAVGTGVGVNTFMARCYALKKNKDADNTAGTGMVLAIITWAIISLLTFFGLKYYVNVSSATEASAKYAMDYGLIVCIGSLGLFVESIWTKVHQSTGNMKTPMIGQIVGTIVNVVLDPLLIFGFGFIPEMGVKGAAIATITGQFAAAIVVGIKGFRKPPKIKEMRFYIKEIYRLGYPSILMQTLMTLYIVVLNIILAGFSDAAVTVLGLYYKWQALLFIPLFSLQVCIVPLLSYNHQKHEYKRNRQALRDSIIVSVLFMLIGIACFELIPAQMIGIFSNSSEVLDIGIPAFRFIGMSFISAVFSLMMPIYFQAVGKAVPSVMLSLTRQIFCLIPIFWLLSFIGVKYVWIAFPVSETITGAVGLILYFRYIKKLEKENSSES